MVHTPEHGSVLKLKKINFKHEAISNKKTDTFFRHFRQKCLKKGAFSLPITARQAVSVEIFISLAQETYIRNSTIISVINLNVKISKCKAQIQLKL